MTVPGSGCLRLCSGRGRSDSFRSMSIPRIRIHWTCVASFSASACSVGQSSAALWNDLANSDFFSRSVSCISIRQFSQGGSSVRRNDDGKGDTVHRIMSNMARDDRVLCPRLESDRSPMVMKAVR